MSAMRHQRFTAFLKARGGGLCFRLRDKAIGGTLVWLTESEAYQLRDALNDAIDTHEERTVKRARHMNGG
ncbi:hypothetical protein GS545_13165 [Rhodococcus hoagii]|nr:hypothetical protein [Prescottella equi]